jgi:hypothetical protein
MPSRERAAIVGWTARIGAVTAEALAEREGVTAASARARLLAAERDGLLARERPLAAHPALYTATRRGLRATRLGGLAPCRVSAANARHLIACAAVAAALERCYPDHRVLGERELRREEQGCGAALASAPSGIGGHDEPLLHRPDLVLCPKTSDRMPVAVEVELTVKAHRRLLAICRAWARCRCVAGVLYLAPPEVERALLRAIDEARAVQRIVVVPLEALPSVAPSAAGRSREPSQAEPNVLEGVNLY